MNDAIRQRDHELDMVAELYGHPVEPLGVIDGEPCPTCRVIRRADSKVQEGGGHYLHVEGGAELAWKLVADLHLLHKTLGETVSQLRAREAA